MSQQPKKRRKLWSDANMVSAMAAVTQEKMPCATAARKFDVPRRTLDRRVKGQVTHGVNPGPASTLTPEEERALMEYVKYSAKRGFPMTKKICKAYAWAVTKKSGRRLSFNEQTGPSDKWWRGFRKRNAGLALRKCDTLDRGRARMANQTVMDQYFDLLKETLEKLDIKHIPNRIYNCDESGVALDPKKEKVIVPVGTKHVYSQQAGVRDHITVHCCVNAAGEYIPPMIIYEKCFPSGAYTRSGSENALYAKSPNGYMDTELYYTWFNKLFLKYATKERPLLLIQNGHKSHLSPQLIDKARENSVEILCLPPHTTHVIRPLDKVVFGPLKKAWSSAMSMLAYANKNFVLSKNDFARVFRVPFENTFTPQAIKTSFRKTGIYPLDPDAIDKTQLHPSSTQEKITTPPSDPGPSGNSSSPPGPSGNSSSPPGPSGNSSPNSSPRSSGNSSPSFSTPGSQAIPCPTCGCSPPQSNPLVAAGLIPSHLHDILAVTNYVSTAKKKTRVVTKARVITNEEYLEELAQKEKEKAEKEQKKEERKLQRERKKLEAEKRKKQVQEKKQERLKNTEEGKSKQQTTLAKTSFQVRSSTRKSKPTARRLEPDFTVDVSSAGSDDSDEETVVYQEEEDVEDEEDEEDEDDVACFKCGYHEAPSDCQGDVNWFQCDNESCERWYHSFCLQKKEKPFPGYHWNCPICVANELV